MLPAHIKIRFSELRAPLLGHTHCACRRPPGSVHGTGSKVPDMIRCLCCLLCVKNKAHCLWPGHLMFMPTKMAALSLQLGWNLRPFTHQRERNLFTFLDRSNLSSPLFFFSLFSPSLHGMWDLHFGLGFEPIPPCSGSMLSYPLDCYGSPCPHPYWKIRQLLWHPSDYYQVDPS